MDGYNIIARARNSSLADVRHLDEFRDRLIEDLTEYQAFTGEQVYVVFDAHRTSGAGHEESRAGVQVIYTKPQETADDRIERLVYELRNTYRQITVATSDLAEQQVVFGEGALRISADEFNRRIREMKTRVKKQVKEETGTKRSSLLDSMEQDIANILEKWRRQ